MMRAGTCTRRTITQDKAGAADIIYTAADMLKTYMMKNITCINITTTQEVIELIKEYMQEDTYDELGRQSSRISEQS